MALVPRDMPARAGQQRRGIAIEVAPAAQAQPERRERIDGKIEPRSIGARMLQEEQLPIRTQDAPELGESRYEQQCGDRAENKWETTISKVASGNGSAAAEASTRS